MVTYMYLPKDYTPMILSHDFILTKHVMCTKVESTIHDHVLSKDNQIAVP